MTPVFQTRRGQGGNCFAACVATILDRPIELIDPLIQMDAPEGGEWMQPLHDYLAGEGISIIYIDANKDGTIPFHTGHDFYAIAAITTNEGYPHAVVVKVAKEGDENVLRMEHDPEPESSGFKKLNGLWFFAKSFTENEKSVDASDRSE